MKLYKKLVSETRDIIKEVDDYLRSKEWYLGIDESGTRPIYQILDKSGNAVNEELSDKVKLYLNYKESSSGYGPLYAPVIDSCRMTWDVYYGIVIGNNPLNNAGCYEYLRELYPMLDADGIYNVLKYIKYFKGSELT